MKQSVNFYSFVDAVESCGRSKQFTYAGKRALFDYLEDYENDMGEEIELDVIALCCEFTEYEALDEFQHAFGAEDYPTMDDVSDSTTAIPVGEYRFIIQYF